MTLLRGVVLDRGMAPARDARVAVEASSRPVQELAYGTDGAGNFTIALPDGAFRLAAHGADGTRGYLDAEVRDGVPDKALLIRLQA